MMAVLAYVLEKMMINNLILKPHCKISLCSRIGLSYRSPHGELDKTTSFFKKTKSALKWPSSKEALHIEWFSSPGL